jgi:hypothetical protein
LASHRGAAYYWKCQKHNELLKGSKESGEGDRSWKAIAEHLCDSHPELEARVLLLAQQYCDDEEDPEVWSAAAAIPPVPEYKVYPLNRDAHDLFVKELDGQLEDDYAVMEINYDAERDPDDEFSMARHKELEEALDVEDHKVDS